MAEQVAEALERLEEQAGKTLGDADDPLLVSVRSGARESMPGMLDTVLNLGLNDESVEGLAKQTENERFAWDSYRRFVQMFGNVARGIAGRGVRGRDQGGQGRSAGVEHDTDLDTDDLKALTAEVQGRLPGAHRRGLPAGPAGAAAARDPRGVRLLDRRARRLLPAAQPHPGRLGHRGQRPADGVRQQGRRRRPPASRSAATRSPASPSRRGDFLVNAQGEDVVSGVRNTRDIAELKDVMPEAHEQLMEILARAREALQATCRTPSSRSRTGSCSCCRRATPSGRRRRRCASRATRWTRGCSRRRRRC